MTIIACGQLVTSTISAQDLRDWVKDRGYSKTTLDGRKIFLCPKKHQPNLVRDGAIMLPRFLFNAAAFWAETGRTVKLVNGNSASLPPAEVRVREVTRSGSIYVVHPQYNGGMALVEPEDLAKL